MIRSRRAPLPLFLLGATLALASPAAADGSSGQAALFASDTGPCAAKLSRALAESRDQEQAPTPGELLESIVPAPRPMGEQAWPGCWICHANAPCCPCDQETAIISCDDYCGCW